MTHGSLFSGIGGFDLAAEWIGWENKFHCEWNEFGQKVLHHYWPQAELFTDIKKSNFTKYANRIDVLSGGFPCQPYSQAGKRLGKEDDRHLWPEMLRAIREISPRWVVGENVRGLTNWNGGVVFDEVQADLEAAGYEVTPFLLPACSVGAPHRRDRIWFVAYSNNSSAKYPIQTGWDLSASQVYSGTTANSNSIRQHECECDNEKFASERGFNALNDIAKNVEHGNVTDTNFNRYTSCRENKSIKGIRSGNDDEQKERSKPPERINGLDGFQRDATNTYCTDSEAWSQREVLGQQNRKKTNGYSNVERRNQWQNFPTVSPICNGDDGLSNRLDSITFPKWRNESIKAGGNAVVPQVVYQIFQAIQDYELLTAPAPDIRQSL